MTLRIPGELELAERVLELESAATGTFPPEQYVLIRLDGRTFSAWTSHLPERLDPRFHAVMQATALSIGDECGAIFVYVQSDEITLVLAPCAGKTQRVFGGRVHKLMSLSAAHVSVVFNAEAVKRGIGRDRLATFDARAWAAPSAVRAAECVLARMLDADRNSTSTYARGFFSAAKMHGTSTGRIREMLHAEGHPWESLPSELRIGSAWVRRVVSRPFSTDEISALPEKHAARAIPNLVVERREFVRLSESEMTFDGIMAVLA